MGCQGNLLLVGNGSYLNRGCEAILRGTVKIVRSAFDKCQFVNANFDVRAIPFTLAETDPSIIHHPLAAIRRLSGKWLAVQTAERLCPSLGYRLRFGPLQQDVSDAQAALSVGGDNYTLDYGVPWVYVNLGRYVLSRRKPLVIWGASVGPFDRDPGFARVIHEHLRREVTAIFVREERSRSYLERHGIAENVYLMPDPAFVMDPEPVGRVDMGFELPEGAIGLNLSPLMARHVTGGNRDAWERMGIDITCELLRRYDRPILLIPHVTSPHSDDHLLLSRIKCHVADNRVAIVPRTLSAAKTKYIISRLSCLVAARTHATIASFSTCVPTVSLAYSRKAWGINEMMFGHTSHVIAPTEVTPSRVAEAVGRSLKDTRNLREHLARKMATISDSAFAAGRKLRCVVGLN
jgi:polysaccharide pyruvyl transferase WcaK-like protein